MRSLLVLVVVCLGTPLAHAKRMACTPPITRPTFTPGDIQAPVSPVITSVVLDNAGLWIEGEFPADAPFAHITYQSSTGVAIELWAAGQTRYHYVCIPSPARDVIISIAAVDASGNESSTIARVVTHERHGRCGTGGTVLALAIVPFFAVLVAILFFARSAVRRRKIRLPGESVSPLVAETITRAVIANTVATIIIGLGLSFALYISNDEAAGAAIVWFPLTRLLRLVAARRMLALLDRGEAAQLHDNLLSADTEYVVVSRWTVQAARRRAVPAASIRGLPKQ